MDEKLRANVAFIATRRARERTHRNGPDYPAPGYVSDQIRKRSALITGSVEADHLHIFDSSRGSHVSGTENVLYDHEQHSKVLIWQEDSSFRGFDLATGFRFAGFVGAQYVTILDFETGEFSFYLI
jgi:hypothetical protein